MVDFGEILGLNNVVIKITFGFALVMLVISVVLWLISSGGGGNK
ncbi:MAG: hypothetical protein WBX01_14460 [Nitrososphaeraceae archaeon]|jgi:hypothetical protein